LVLSRAGRDDAKGETMAILAADLSPATSALPTIVTAPARRTANRHGRIVVLQAQSKTSMDQSIIAPGGFINFEMRYPAEVKDSVPAFATAAQVDVAHSTNKSVNTQITWRETQLWTLDLNGPAYGDCKSFALTKRHMLRGLGIPDGAVRIVIVYAEKYQGLHMILEMRTADDVFVLDSLANDSGANFYRTSAIPASYSIVKYEVWGRPSQWMTPGVMGSTTMRQSGKLLAMRIDGLPWIHSPHARTSGVPQTMASARTSVIGASVSHLQAAGQHRHSPKPLR